MKRAIVTWSAVLFSLAILLGLSGSPAWAQDTVSYDEVEFFSEEEMGEVEWNNDIDTALAGSQETDAEASDPDSEAESRSLWAIFIAGFIGGFAALLMPCIFPMLPLTVSFFTKSSHTKRKAVMQALLYGLFIIVIYVALGLIITIIFGADALNSLSTNGIFNMLFFILLVVFAVSFLGAFELTLPASWVNKMDAKADKGGLVGLFFMAATLAVVSFSCTGPIIGTLLVQAATMGELLGPAVGMFGFSLALAIPFALFAMFPGWMKGLPSSGGWLNSVKVTLGFLELALALKFLSNVDLAYHWKWLDREVFLVLWIIIFGLLGLYLLGKIRFAHDSPVQYLSIPRLFLSILVLSFTMYMVPGLWGAPLRAISAFLPPQATQDFDLYTASFGGGSGAANQGHGQPRKHADLFHAPLNLDVFFDYDEGIAHAKEVGKPVMIDFTGHACVNCRKMEASVWPEDEVYSVLRDELVIIQLYVDDKTNLPEAEQYVSPFSGKRVRTIGNKWSDVQAAKFNSNSQPYYVLLDPHTEKVLVAPSGADYNASSYRAFLQSGIAAFGK
ncbi:protein-disulfide reductase DsbD family protein [Parapedobacter deserti]|uniref:Protein-disulfide reductase DsbD family protein n=1 Tax=Parapedobacter deserti TaxID=1912957 RepID=A0ABV7JQD3_9SPHI